MNHKLVILLFFLIPYYSYTQIDHVADSVAITDSTSLQNTLEGPFSFAVIQHFQGKTYPNPKTSALASVLLPGAGQMYNRQVWKVPLLYGGVAFALINLSANQSNYRTFRTAYENHVAGEPTGFPNLSQRTLKDLRDESRRQVELNYMGVAAIYIIGILDAFVAGHLATFDVSDNLSISLPPVPLTISIHYSL